MSAGTFQTKLQELSGAETQNQFLNHWFIQRFRVLLLPQYELATSSSTGMDPPTSWRPASAASSRDILYHFGATSRCSSPLSISSTSHRTLFADSSSSLSLCFIYQSVLFSPQPAFSLVITVHFDILLISYVLFASHALAFVASLTALIDS